MRAPAGPDMAGSPLRRFGFFAMLALVFIRMSMVHEALAAQLGVNLYLLYLFGPPAILCAVLAGDSGRLLRSRPALLWLAFVFWMILATPFSSWTGGSLAHVMSYSRTELPMLLVTAALIATWDECLLFMGTMALACLATLVIGKVFMQVIDGRVTLEMGSSISNSNDFAAHLILLLSFLVYYGIRPKARPITRLAVFGIICYGVFLILGTASRGAELGIAAIGLFVLARVSVPKKLMICFLGATAAAALVAVLPSQTLLRLSALSADSGHLEAVDSMEDRRYLLIKSLEYTAQRPLFGVGPGQFSSFEGAMSRLAGLHGNWHETHNAYTQISSECGIPAMIFYLAALIATFRSVSKIYRETKDRPELGDISSAAFTIMIAMTGFMVATFFLAFGYKLYQPSIVGFVAAFTAVVPLEISARTVSSVVPSVVAAIVPPSFARRKANPLLSPVRPRQR